MIGFILSKARSHKYIRKEGVGKDARYIYKESEKEEKKSSTTPVEFLKTAKHKDGQFKAWWSPKEVKEFSSFDDHLEHMSFSDAKKNGFYRVAVYPRDIEITIPPTGGGKKELSQLRDYLKTSLTTQQAMDVDSVEIITWGDAYGRRFTPEDFFGVAQMKKSKSTEHEAETTATKHTGRTIAVQKAAVFKIKKVGIPLIKGKERPIGYRTPGGYVKTAKGWRKVADGGPVQPAAPKDDKKDDKPVEQEQKISDEQKATLRMTGVLCKDDTVLKYVNENVQTFSGNTNGPFEAGKVPQMFNDYVKIAQHDITVGLDRFDLARTAELAEISPAITADLDPQDKKIIDDVLSKFKYLDQMDDPLTGYSMGDSVKTLAPDVWAANKEVDELSNGRLQDELYHMWYDDDSQKIQAKVSYSDLADVRANSYTSSGGTKLIDASQSIINSLENETDPSLIAFRDKMIVLNSEVKKHAAALARRYAAQLAYVIKLRKDAAFTVDEVNDAKQLYSTIHTYPADSTVVKILRGEEELSLDLSKDFDRAEVSSMIDDFRNIIKLILGRRQETLTKAMRETIPKKLQDAIILALQYNKGLNYHYGHYGAGKGGRDVNGHWKSSVDVSPSPISIAELKNAEHPEEVLLKHLATHYKTKYLANRVLSSFIRPGQEKATVSLRTVPTDVRETVFKKMREAFDTKEHGGFGFKIHHVFQLGDAAYYDEYKKLEKSSPSESVTFSYHGTSFDNGVKIAKGGFIVPKKARTGRMLGDGVYGTEVSSKALQYAGGTFGRRVGNRGVLFVCKTAKGKIMTMPAMQRGDNYFKQGFDTVTIHKGTGGLKNPEFCTKDPKRFLPMYWVDVEITPSGQFEKSMPIVLAVRGSK